MKTRIILAVIAALFAVAVGTLTADGFGKGSHPQSANNGIGSPRFPNHYASPGRPTHP